MGQDQLLDRRHGRFHQHQPEQDHQDLLGGQRGLAATNVDCQHLRHELPVHARTQPSLGLPPSPGIDDRQRHCADVVLQEAGLVEVIRLA